MKLLTNFWAQKNKHRKNKNVPYLRERDKLFYAHFRSNI